MTPHGRRRGALLTVALLALLVVMRGGAIAYGGIGGIAAPPAVVRGGAVESALKEYAAAQATWLCSPRSQSLDPGFAPRFTTFPSPTPPVRADATPYVRAGCG